MTIERITEKSLGPAQYISVATRQVMHKVNEIVDHLNGLQDAAVDRGCQECGWYNCDGGPCLCECHASERLPE